MILFQLFTIIGYFRDFAFILLTVGLTVSLLLIIMYGWGDFERVPEPSGNYSAGIQKIWTQADQFVMVYYPISRREIPYNKKSKYHQFGARGLKNVDKAIKYFFMGTKV